MSEDAPRQWKFHILLSRTSITVFNKGDLLERPRMLEAGGINGDPPSNDGVGGASSGTSLRLFIGVVCLGWYLAVNLVCALGYLQLWRHYSSVPLPAASSASHTSETPHVTILRPVKGQEPALYECLASTFRQTYPMERLTIFFCISSFEDPALPVLQRLIDDFPDFDAKILVESQDPSISMLGPNPKIRNMSRGYREAKGDIVWVVDCNVWVGRGVAGRMVDKLCGFGPDGRPKNMSYKFVHQLPLAVDIGQKGTVSFGQDITQNRQGEDIQVASTSTESHDIRTPSSADDKTLSLLSRSGGRLEELFLSSSHAKFYTAINTVLIAPCIVGKSNMYRRSHLNHLTTSNPERRPGIDFFSDNICEDHLIGDLLWKGQVAEEEAGEKWGKHAIVLGDPAIQPVAYMSVKEYIARRVRWLRVRKFTVTLATLVEPGTESFLCSFYGAYAISTLPFFERDCNIPPSWATFLVFWLLSVVVWAFVDWTVYLKLHSAVSIEIDEHSPVFVRPPIRRSRRPFREWLVAWLGREALAFPIWTWAVLGGTTVAWRGQKFWVGTDMRVHEIHEQQREHQKPRSNDQPRVNGHASRKKARRE